MEAVTRTEAGRAAGTAAVEAARQGDLMLRQVSLTEAARKCLMADHNGCVCDASEGRLWPDEATTTEAGRSIGDPANMYEDSSTSLGSSALATPAYV